jgi:hypothetical protein
LWRLVGAGPSPACVRSIAKSVLGDRFVFDEHHGAWDPILRATWEQVTLAAADSRRTEWLVIPELRAVFGDRFRFDGDRAVLVGSGDELHEPEITELHPPRAHLSALTTRVAWSRIRSASVSGAASIGR